MSNIEPKTIDDLYAIITDYVGSNSKFQQSVLDYLNQLTNLVMSSFTSNTTKKPVPTKADKSPTLKELRNPSAGKSKATKATKNLYLETMHKLSAAYSNNNEELEQALNRYLEIRVKKGMNIDQWRALLDDLSMYMKNHSIQESIDIVNRSYKSNYMQIVYDNEIDNCIKRDFNSDWERVLRAKPVPVPEELWDTFMQEAVEDDRNSEMNIKGGHDWKNCLRSATVRQILQTSHSPWGRNDFPWALRKYNFEKLAYNHEWKFTIPEEQLALKLYLKGRPENPAYSAIFDAWETILALDTKMINDNMDAFKQVAVSVSELRNNGKILYGV